MLAVVCPGQGAQTPGMLEQWLEIDSVARRLNSLADATDVDIIEHGTTSDAETIRDTAIAQPLLVATAIATGREILGDRIPGVIAGHSVGEFGAAALAGVVSDEEAMRLVSVRSQAMAAAAASSEPTGMAAVLGGDPSDVHAALHQLGLTAANVNSSGQVVAAGSLDLIQELLTAPPEKARVIPLQVAGAFHTEYMKPAISALAGAAAETLPSNPVTALLTNSDGSILKDGSEVLSRLVSQVANPVRWDLCQDTFIDLGVTAILELAPGGVLTGLAKRAVPGVELFAVKSASDLAAAREFVEAHV